MFWGLGADPDILALWVCQARFNVCEAELEDTPGNMGSRGLLCEAQRRRGKFQRPRWREGKRQKEKAMAVRCQLCCKAKAKQFSNVRGVFNLSILPKTSHTITENYGVQPYRIPKTSVWCIFILQQKLFCSYMHKMVFPHFLSIRICCRHSSESSQSSSRSHLQWRPAFRWETPYTFLLKPQYTDWSASSTAQTVCRCVCVCNNFHVGVNIDENYTHIKISQGFSSPCEKQEHFTCLQCLDFTTPLSETPHGKTGCSGAFGFVDQWISHVDQSAWEPTFTYID